MESVQDEGSVNQSSSSPSPPPMEDITDMTDTTVAHRKKRSADELNSTANEQTGRESSTTLTSDEKQRRVDHPSSQQVEAKTIFEFTMNSHTLQPRSQWPQVVPAINPTTSDASSPGSAAHALDIPGASPLPRPKEHFGDDHDSALHYCLRHRHFASAWKLIMAGALVDIQNLKGVTPLIVAAQTGNLSIVKLLNDRGANESHTTLSGSTALLHAAHYGHTDVVEYLLSKNRKLLELANFHQTTPLMRASQEGHLGTVKLLCERGAMVNRKNTQGMTALMLCSQRGNSKVCSYLIGQGADLNAMTQQASTSLVLACKRQHLETVEILVRAGAELFVQDGRGRTARDIIIHRYSSRRHPEATSDIIQKLIRLLDPINQVHQMRLQARQERSFAWIRTWTLLQKRRATPRLISGEFLSDPTSSRHEFGDGFSSGASSSTFALLRMMDLPLPLVQHIAEFSPLPNIFDKRVTMLIGRCSVDPNAALLACFDLIDELLEEGGFLKALDHVLVLPPSRFRSWTSWLSCRLRNARPNSEPADIPTLGPLAQTARPNATLAKVPRPGDVGAIVEHRRQAGYLQMLTKYVERLQLVLISPPYNMVPMLVRQLSNISDICSVVRRLGSHSGCGGFSANVAMDIILFTSRLCSWYARDSWEW